MRNFREKPDGDGGNWINGGFMVLSLKVLDYIEGDTSAFGNEPLIGAEQRDGELFAYRHAGFWQAMDTLRDKSHLEELWKNGQAPWKVW